ncbi:PEP-CTERM sorting domain-containing protein [Nitrosovibrio sp. Nv17]|uniref:PEP-CTERM sorting domain-containing protein n=1 Tax=Nitrosovibrio sp. Nv17 TaxID=1855339 RepID=UPI0009084C94|nr:PEP-CTERM protein-sorting domain-containing protein [Nitrosovibrio sp. Nv17]
MLHRGGRLVRAMAMGGLVTGLAASGGAWAAPWSNATTRWGNEVEPNHYYLANLQSDYQGGGVVASVDDSSEIQALNYYDEAVTIYFNGQASALADYDGLKAYAKISVTNPVALGANSPYVIDTDFNVDPNGVPALFQASGSASVEDTITLDTADVVSIRLKLGLNGSFSGPESLYGINLQSAGVRLSDVVFQPDGRTEYQSLYNVGHPYFDGQPSFVNETELWTRFIPVENGVAQYRLELEAYAEVYTDSYYAPEELGNGTYEATADFFHTLDILGVYGYDADGNQIDLGSAIGLEGWSYAVAAPVPEPETYAMLLAGLGIVGALARRRRGTK